MGRSASDKLAVSAECSDQLSYAALYLRLCPVRSRGFKFSDGGAGMNDRNSALCGAWLDWLGKHGRQPLTVYQYAGKLQALCEHADTRPLSTLTLTDLEAFVGRQRRNGTTGADATRERDVIVVRGLYRWANSHGLMTVNPAEDLQGPSVRNHNPRAIPDDLWAKVWASPLHDDMRVVLGLGYYCGLRREEICRLTVDHWDGERFVHFKRKGDRNSKTTGVVPVVSCARLYAEKRPDLLAMPEDFLAPLSALLSLSKSWVVPWGASSREALRTRPNAVGPPPGMTNPDVINRRLGMLLGALGLARSAFTPHALRHSFVTNMLTMGVPLTNVSVLANHSSLSITQRYIKIAEDPLAAFLGKPMYEGGRW